MSNQNKKSIYEAQAKAYFKFHGTYDDECDLIQAMTLFQEIKDSEYYRFMSGDPDLKMFYSSDKRRSYAYYIHEHKGILLIDGCMKKLVICHEVAHHLTSQRAIDIPAHGNTFVSVLLALVSLFCESGFFATLLEEFAHNDVEYSEPEFNKYLNFIGGYYL